MAERTNNGETQALIAGAVRDVIGLYLGDEMSSLLGTQSPAQRDEFWQETAREHSSFADKINTLSQTLKGVKVTKEAYSSRIIAIMGMHFRAVEDIGAHQLLADLLLGRTMSSPGYMDYDMEPSQEAQVMATELSVEDGLRGEQIKSVTLERVVEGVLTGSLNLTGQTRKQSR